MIRLGLRLLFADGRRSVVMFVVTCASVAAGGCLLFLTLSVPSAVQARADRQAWNEGASSLEPGADTPYTALTTTTAHSPGGDITQVWVAPDGPAAPVFPGLRRNPRPGESFQSPAMRRLTAREPELAHRYGAPADTVGGAALASPDTLMVVRHLSIERMPPLARSVFTRFPTESDEPQRAYAGGLLETVSALAAVALVLPVVLLLATLGRLQASGRERRLAALRLAGATSGQIHGLTVIEAGVTGVCGAAAAPLLFRLVLPWATHFSDDLRWFPSDLTPSPVVMAAIVAALPALVVIPALLGLRRAAVTPLGAARRAVHTPLSRWRLMPPLAAGAAGTLVVLTGAGDRAGGRATAAAAFALLVLAFLPAGPVLMRAVGHLLRRGGGAVRLLAGARIVAEPRDVFRALVTVVLAVFVSTVLTVMTPAAVAGLSGAGRSGLTSGVASASDLWLTHAQATDLARRLAQISGISDVTPVLRGTVDTPPGDTGTANTTLWIGDCARLGPLIGLPPRSCARGDALVAPQTRPVIPADGTLLITDVPADRLPRTLGEDGALTGRAHPKKIATVPIPGGFDAPGIIVAPGAVPERIRARARPDGLLLRFGSPQALERARSVVDRFAPGTVLATGAESERSNLDGAIRARRALILACLIAFLVAGLGLAASTTIGFLERRREYAFLRAGGVPVSVLRWSMLLETAGPMAAATAAATAMGLSVAFAITGTTMPTPAFWWATIWPSLLGYTIALGPALPALAALGRITATEETRFE